VICNPLRLWEEELAMKHLLKTLVLSAVVTAAGWAATAPAQAQTAPNNKKTNVLVVLTDDMGMDQLQLYGYNSVPPAPATPNLASLQTAGITFRNAWTMPACSTARGVLYTGRYPFRTNLEAALGPSDLANSMISPYEKTIPKLLSKAGYSTALFGKFHVGLQGNNPYGIGMVQALGWNYFNGWLDVTGDPSSIDTTAGLGDEGSDENGVGLYPNGYVPGTKTTDGTDIANGADAGACYSVGKSCQYMSTPARDKNPAGRQCRDNGGIFVPNAACVTPRPSFLNFQTLSAHYVSPLVINENGRAFQVPPTDKRSRTFRNVEQTDAAIKWINTQKRLGKPWFATYSTATVHTPMQVPPIDTLPPDAPDANNADLSTTEGKILIANQMIQAMDHELGRLLLSTGLATKVGDQLVLTAASSNTTVIYVNDNGSLGSQVRLPFDPTRAKGTAYQTGVWTPMVVAGAKVNPANHGKDVQALVNIADLYELIGNVAGINVRKDNPYIVDSVPMVQYLANSNAPSLRNYDFNLVGPNIQANGGSNGPCQFPGSSPPSCSQIPVTKGVCEDNGGTWFGEGASGTYTTTSAENPDETVSMDIKTFQYCCQVQQYIVENGGVAGTVIPTTSMAVRDKFGFKLVRNQWNDYDANSESGCQQTTVNELYTVGQSNPLAPEAPLLDTEQRLIETPYSELQQFKYDELTTYLDDMLASEPDCLAKGDGNDDGVVNRVDLQNYRKMVRKTSGSSWYDVNTDGYTNSSDEKIIIQNLGTSCKN
jgi:arylsulfatase A-like enzyme